MRAAGAVLFLAVLLVSISMTGASESNLVLSRMGVAEILHYLEVADNNKGLSEDQMAAKYILGEVRPDLGVPSRVVLQWRSLPPSEQRQLKVIWFREHYMKLDIEEVGKHVQLEYLRQRAKAEYRENPLEMVPKELPMDKLPAKPPRHGKGLKKGKPPVPADTWAIRAKKPKPPRKSDTMTAVARPAKPALSARTGPSPKSGAPQSDTSGRTGMSETTLKKFPWHGGIPTRMKNE